MLNFHGGGFVIDSGSMTKNIHMAALSGTRVISALYRLARVHPFPAAVDDAEAAYREALKHHRPANIVIYGTSAGAILTAQLMIRLKAEKLPMPAAIGTFSLTADVSRAGDSEGYLLTLSGLGMTIERRRRLMLERPTWRIWRSPPCSATFAGWRRHSSYRACAINFSASRPSTTGHCCDPGWMPI